MILPTSIDLWLGLAVCALAMVVAASATLYFARRDLFDNIVEVIVGAVAMLVGLIGGIYLAFKRGRGEGAGGEPNSGHEQPSAADVVNVDRVTTEDTRNEVEALTDEISDEARRDDRLSLRDRVRRWRERTRRDGEE